MWFIISVVTAAALFGNKPHTFSSAKHFPTEEACKAYMPEDAEELLDELDSIGATGPVHLESHCELDADGDPV